MLWCPYLVLPVIQGGHSTGLAIGPTWHAGGELPSYLFCGYKGVDKATVGSFFL